MFSPVDPTIEMVGYAAAVLTSVSFFPQVWRTYRSKSAGDLSIVMLVMFTAGVCLWLVYGLVHGSIPIAAANAITLAQSIFLIVLRLRYGRP
ncbi:MAG TPA: SemiSWEET transporter [Vicinamibacterales bacterium]|nr:SemiSWEET transporter [Vicinamibacterales bacterium]